MRWFSILTVLFLVVFPVRGAERIAAWTVPSLSQPGVDMVIRLFADGTASEEIGTFRGEGKWTREGDGYRIGWKSGWSGVLQPDGQGKWKLLTWKPDADRNAAPNDRQVATPMPN